MEEPRDPRLPPNRVGPLRAVSPRLAPLICPSWHRMCEVWGAPGPRDSIYTPEAEGQNDSYFPEVSASSADGETSRDSRPPMARVRASRAANRR